MSPYQPNAEIHLSLRDVGKRFGAISVLSRLDLDIAQGEFVAVIGKSGCGKSTLLRLLAGLDRPTQGHLRLRDQAMAGRNAEARVMFQEARLLPWRSVLDNVALGLAATKSSIREKQSIAATTLAQVGLGDRARDWPSVLSGGQQQRVALARALVSKPPLLLLDEPLGALDALTRLEMQALLDRVWQTHGFTAVLVTHDVEEALALADRVIVLEKGGISLELPVTLPRPRDRSAPAFVVLKRRLLDAVLQTDSQSQTQSQMVVAKRRLAA